MAFTVRVKVSPALTVTGVLKLASWISAVGVPSLSAWTRSKLRSAVAEESPAVSVTVAVPSLVSVLL